MIGYLKLIKIIKDLVTLFPVIRDWIAEFLDYNKDMTASLVGRNMLIEQVVSLKYMHYKYIIFAMQYGYVYIIQIYLFVY